MSLAWTSSDMPRLPPVGPVGWGRVVVRGAALGGLLLGGLVLLLLLRPVERAVAGGRRPLTPAITQLASRAALAVVGLRHTVRGRPMEAAGGMVANHSSWLDIFALNAAARIHFVSKAEIARWPGVGWFARASGTIFIERVRRRARDHAALFARRLAAGHRLLFFPEGTSTDNRRVLAFKTTLFAPFVQAAPAAALRVQPVTVIYHAPAGADPRFYGWWGGMDFVPHLRTVLAARRQGEVEVVFHPAEPACAHGGRKELARACERAVRSALPQGR